VPEEKNDMCCTIRMVAMLTLVMVAIAATLHFTGDLMQAGIVGVVASIYAIGFLLATCGYLYEKVMHRPAALKQEVQR